MFGGFHELGFSFEWHDFEMEREGLDWAPSFHPGSLEICLNLAGDGTVAGDGSSLRLTPGTCGFYVPGEAGLRARREAGGRHQFLTVELARPFLRTRLAASAERLHPVVRALVEEGPGKVGVGGVERLNPRQLELVRALRSPPVPRAARRLWYEARALDVLVECCFAPAADELFCQRQLRLQRDRVAEAIGILKRNLAEPPSLGKLAREVGVSPCYLSRTFSREMGVSLSQFLRRLRLDRAAELLRSGEYNVTEAAFEVGYNSLSHFSAAFHETFGICPGLYPLRAKPAAKGK